MGGGLAKGTSRVCSGGRQGPKGGQEATTTTAVNLLKFINQVLAHADATGGEGAQLIKEADEWPRSGIQVATPTVSRSNRLKSVLDKLKYKRDAGAGVKTRLE